MGDSLIAASAAMEYALQHPEDEVSLMVRAPYATALRLERGFRLLPYHNNLQANLLILWWRITRQSFDVCCLLRGYGRRSRQLVERVPARRKIVGDSRMASTGVELANIETSDGDEIYDGNRPLIMHSWSIIHYLDSGTKRLDRLSFPVLADNWKSCTDKKYVLLCPQSDEVRRTFTTETTISMCTYLQMKFPKYQVLVVVRRASDILDTDLPFMAFGTIPTFTRLLMLTHAWFGADTGLYHLAAAAGVPCTVFFGPTQPKVVILSRQENVEAVRLKQLGNRHCDVIDDCPEAHCLHEGIKSWMGGHQTCVIDKYNDDKFLLPKDCLLTNS